MKIQKKILGKVSISKIQRMNLNENHIMSLPTQHFYEHCSMKDMHSSTLEGTFTVWLSSKLYSI